MKKASCIFSIILTLLMSCMMPFPIFADGDSLSAPFVGFNIHVTGYDMEMGQIHFPNINYDGSSYRATIQGQLNCSTPQVASNGCDVYELENQQAQQTGTGGLQITFLGVAQKVSSFNATLSSPVSTFLYEIEIVLDANYVGSVTLHTGSDSSETIFVNGSSFSFSRRSSQPEDYTVTIDSYTLQRNIFGTWDFPIESFPFIYQFWDNGVQMVDVVKSNSYFYPLFRTYNDNKILFQVYIPNDVDVEMVFMMTRYINDSNFLTYFHTDHDSDLLVKDYKLITSDFGTPNRNFRFCKMTLGNSGQSQTFRFYANESFLFMPIYLSRKDFRNVSTDFALNYDLTNNFLDAVVYGTEQTNQSSDNLDNSSDQMNNQMQDLINTEDGYNEQFNNSLNNIDFTSPAGNQNLLSSANFVITVFNGLIQNNFLSILIVIICILIIGKKVIGK